MTGAASWSRCEIKPTLNFADTREHLDKNKLNFRIFQSQNHCLQQSLVIYYVYIYSLYLPIGHFYSFSGKKELKHHLSFLTAMLSGLMKTAMVVLLKGSFICLPHYAVSFLQLSTSLHNP